jgi:integrase
VTGPSIEEATAIVARARDVAGHSAGTARLDGWVLKTIGVPPQDATLLDLERVILRSKNRGTRATYANRLRSVFDLLNRVGAIDNRVHEQLPRLSMPETQPRPLSDDQVRRLLDGMREPHVDAVRIALLTGARAMEVWALTGADLSDGPTGPELLLRGKGGKDVWLPAHPGVVEVFDRRATLGRLFGWSTPCILSRMVGKEMRRVLGQKVEFHQCRHTFGTRVMKASGNDLLVASRLLRHARLETSRVYIAVSDERPREAILGLTA